MKITKDTTISELIELAPEKVNILLDLGMHCIGCRAAISETIEEACLVHNIDVNDVLTELNS